MDFREAFKTMEEGERVTHTNLDGYWALNAANDQLVSGSPEGVQQPIDFAAHTSALFRSMFQNHWELYDEPTTDEDEYWWSQVDFEPHQPRILKTGDSNDDVKALQQELIKYGAAIDDDGVYGRNVRTAVKNIQIAHGLVADGIFGDKTAAAMRGQPIPGSLTQAAMNWAARTLRCRVEAIMAVSTNESRGVGFFSNGFPTILYERHWMHRLAKRRGMNTKPLIRQQPNIINTRYGGYYGGIDEYERLNKAKLINEDCALQSASWGCYQIMAFHYERLQYRSPQAYVQAMMKGENEHLRAFVRFIKTDSRLLEAIQGDKPNFHRFAIVYNGPAAVERNDYPARMQDTFNTLLERDAA